MDLGLKDSTVLVTGSSSGVGRAAAIAFGAEGARVGLTYHSNREGAEATARDVRAAGGDALVVQYDLEDADSIRATIDALRDQWGTLNVLVNNAAPMEISNPNRQPFEEVPFEQWETLVHGGLDGLARTIRAALPLMRASGWARMVNISSTTATDGWPGLGAYGAAKAGMHGLTRTLALELGPDNILCNVVALGAVMTERNLRQIPAEQQKQIEQHTPTRRAVTPEDVAAAIVFLGSQANRQITGEVVRVTGGT